MCFLAVGWWCCDITSGVFTYLHVSLHVFMYAPSDWSFSFIPKGHYFDYFPEEMNSNCIFQPRSIPESNVQMDSFDNQHLISMMIPNETYSSGILHPATSTTLWRQENHSPNMGYYGHGMVCFIQIQLRNLLSLQLRTVIWNICQSSGCLFIQRFGLE